MDLELAGKRAAVMAASQGIGRATALALSREGARVAICARDAERLRQTAKEISDETGNEVVAIPADLSKAEDVRAFVDGAAEKLGGLDVLVTNTGGPPAGRFEALTDADWEQAFQLVTMSYVRAVRAALPHFRAAGGGAVTAIESMSVKHPIASILLSNSLRPSVVALSKSLSNEYAKDGIRFNVVLPGSIDTDRIRELYETRAEEQRGTAEEMAEADAAEIPVRRLGQPVEVGNAIAYLSSPLAAYVTGTLLAVDGGLIRSVS